MDVHQNHLSKAHLSKDIPGHALRCVQNFTTAVTQLLLGKFDFPQWTPDNEDMLRLERDLEESGIDIERKQMEMVRDFARFRADVVLNRDKQQGIIPKQPWALARQLHDQGRYKKSAKMREQAAQEALSLDQMRTAAAEYLAKAREYTIRALEQDKWIARAYATYRLAISYYEQADRNDSARQCREELAWLYESQGEYIMAADMYVTLGDERKVQEMWRNWKTEFSTHE